MSTPLSRARQENATNYDAFVASITVRQGFQTYFQFAMRARLFLHNGCPPLTGLPRKSRYSALTFVRFTRHAFREYELRTMPGGARRQEFDHSQHPTCSISLANENQEQTFELQIHIWAFVLGFRK